MRKPYVWQAKPTGIAPEHTTPNGESYGQNNHIDTGGGFASFGLPATSGFIAEFLCFYGMWLTYPTLALLSVVGIVLTAIYVLRALQKIFLGPFREETYPDLPDARTTEWVAISGLALLLIVFGLWPRPLVDLTDTGLKTAPGVQQTAVLNGRDDAGRVPEP